MCVMRQIYLRLFGIVERIQMSPKEEVVNKIKANCKFMNDSYEIQLL